MYNKMYNFFFFCRGMEVTTKCVALQKDETNLLGISIGGGAPLCPCLYIVQVKKLFLENVNYKSKTVSYCFVDI